MNYRELIRLLTPRYGAGEARAIVLMVMEERFGLTQTDLLLGKDTTLSAYERKDFKKIASRIIAGEPVQYVLGRAIFCGHSFRVTPDVLIPRPETEELVQVVIDEYSPVKLLDLCTGSGCIAISLALAIPEADVTGVDISEAALAVARQNAEELGATNVSFARADVLDKGYNPLQQFDIIVSNPPYVRQSEAADMEPHVLEYEPALALFVPDDDPLRFYQAIACIADKCLSPNGFIAVEASSFLAHETACVFSSHGFTDVKILADQFGKERMITCRKVNFN